MMGKVDFKNISNTSNKNLYEQKPKGETILGKIAKAFAGRIR